jgi:hypothetical protein
LSTIEYDGFPESLSYPAKVGILQAGKREEALMDVDRWRVQRSMIGGSAKTDAPRRGRCD